MEENQINLSLPRWNVEEECGYKPMTTFWQDFSIADKFGAAAIEDTYRRVKKEWTDNHKYWTELVMVLNHKIWFWHEKDETLARLYDRLWRDAEAQTEDWFEEDLEYFYQVTD